MVIINDPTVKDIVKFCDELKKQLLVAKSRGSSIELGIKTKTKDIFSPEYGQAPVDSLYAGAVFIAKFNERDI